MIFLTEPVAVIIRDSPYDLDYCHIDDGSEMKTFCGISAAEAGGFTCGYYEGEAICPTCGFPCCPRCAVMADIEDRLEA